MGIINVTPDSFSDGGQLLDPAARDRCRRADGGRRRRPARRRRRVHATRRRAAGRGRGTPSRAAGHRGACGARDDPDLDRHLQAGGRGRGARAPARRWSTTSAAFATSPTLPASSPAGAPIDRADAHARTLARHVQARRSITTSSTRCSTNCARASRSRRAPASRRAHHRRPRTRLCQGGQRTPTKRWRGWTNSVSSDGRCWSDRPANDS